MSTLKVNAIKRYTGTAITIGESGDTITITAGATLTGTITGTYTGTVESETITAKGDGSSADGFISLNCSQNTHAVKLQSPAHSAAATYTLILPTGVGSDQQVLASDGTASNQLTWITAAETKPTISSISPSTIENTATTVTITGTGYQNAPYVDAISSTGVITPADTVTYNSATEVEAAFTLAADGTYYLRVENPDGNAVRSSTAILTVSDAPVWTTGSGSLGSFTGGTTGSLVSVAATGDTVVISETTDVLTNSAQGNCQLASGGAISSTGGFPNSSYTSETTFNFTLRATDAQGQTADRNFSMTATYQMSNSVRLDG